MNAKTTFKLLALMLFGMFALTLFSQGVILPDPPDSETTVPEFVNWTTLVYGALVTVFGYISSYIPGINKINDKAWRVAAIAIVLAGIFLIRGFSNGLSLVFGYLSSVGAYDLIFSKLKKTPGLPAMTASRNQT